MAEEYMERFVINCVVFYSAQLYLLCSYTADQLATLLYAVATVVACSLKQCITIVHGHVCLRQTVYQIIAIVFVTPNSAALFVKFAKFIVLQ